VTKKWEMGKLFGIHLFNGIGLPLLDLPSTRSLPLLVAKQ